MSRITPEQSEQLQEDIRTHCEGLPPELIAALCEVVASYSKQ